MTIRAKKASPTYAKAIKVKSNLFLFGAVVVIVVVVVVVVAEELAH